MPNPPVDMSSWGRSACYPRRTFYPLSDGPSMRNHRITMPYFRTCSTCMSHSQAPLCHCTLRTVTKRAEGTFRSLRYSFGGDHPSQTTHHALFPFTRVRPRTNKGWYFNNGSTMPGAAKIESSLFSTYARAPLGFVRGEGAIAQRIKGTPGITG